MRSNVPEGKVAVMLTREQIDFIITNCQSNVDFARNQLLAWATLPPEAFDAGMRESFMKLDALKSAFMELQKTVESSDNG